MAYAVPIYPRARVDAAGDALAAPSEAFIGFHDPMDDVLGIINNWRSSHRYPLNAMQVTLRQRAKKVDSTAIVPQRLKRMPAIEAKLRLHAGMKLSRMHDIGGCRAILKDVEAVRTVTEMCREAFSKNPKRRAKLIREYNYMDGNSPGPKPDGYRGVHLVYQYRSEREARKVYNGLRIEVQIRSQLQHAFSTAVETASIFTEQPIKSIKANLSDERWRRFFALMGNALASREGTTPIVGLPSGQAELKKEISELADCLSVERVLTGWGRTIEELTGHPAGAKTFLLLLDTEEKTTKIIAYTEREIGKTDQAYLEMEKQFKGKPTQQVVLVDAESIDALRIAYPNFYLDTRAFVLAMREVID